MRRGDLQYTSVKVGADEIAAIVARHLRPGELLYIATDEKARAAGERRARRDILHPRPPPPCFFRERAPRSRAVPLVFRAARARSPAAILLGHARRGRGSRARFSRNGRAARGVPRQNVFGDLHEARASGPARAPGAARSPHALRPPLFLRRSPSTFSGFITRLRGYLGHSDNSTFYFAPTEKYDALHQRTWPTSPYYTREWPIAWEDIDLPDGSPPWDAARERESTQRANRQRKRAEDCAQKERLGFSVITGKCSETERYFGVEPAAGSG